MTHLFILPKGNGKEDGGGGGGGCGGGGCGGGGGGGGCGGGGGGGCGGGGGSGRVNCHFVFTSLIFAEIAFLFRGILHEMQPVVYTT